MKKFIVIITMLLALTTIAVNADFNDVVGPTVGGAALGGIFGGRRGAGIGAGVGLGVGLMNSASRDRQRYYRRRPAYYYNDYDYDYDYEQPGYRQIPVSKAKSYRKPIVHYYE